MGVVLVTNVFCSELNVDEVAYSQWDEAGEMHGKSSSGMRVKLSIKIILL